MTNSLINVSLELPDVLTPPFEDRPSLASLGRVHFIGIGGAGMSAIASLMLSAQMQVTGSDQAESSMIEQLREQGATIFVPQAAENIVNVDTVVVSTAIKESNPELMAAREKGINVIHRSQALATTMSDSQVIAVAGTHGKTTTSSMISVMLAGLHKDPSFAVGSTIAGFNTNARLSAATEDRWFVAEADESDGSFVRYRPNIAVVTNVEPDHLDFYGSAEKVYEAFNRFVASMEENGVLVTCADDAGALDLAQRAREAGGDVVTYGFSEEADVRLSATTSQGIVCSSQVEWSVKTSAMNLEGSGVLSLRVPGIHNQLNAAATLICGLLTGEPAENVLSAVSEFTGTDRRFTLRGEANGIKVFDDYAHHPTEVFRALEAGRTVAAGHSLYALFQPHLFSRTREFAGEFAEALAQADRAYVIDIYPARELPIEGVTSQLITEAGFTEVLYSTPEEAIQNICQQVLAGDVVMTVGAGDVTQYGPRIVQMLQQKFEAE